MRSCAFDASVLHPRFDGQPAGPAIDHYDPTCSNSSRIPRVNWLRRTSTSKRRTFARIVLARARLEPRNDSRRGVHLPAPQRPPLGLASIGETRSTICEHSATASVHCARNSIASRSEELTGWAPYRSLRYNLAADDLDTYSRVCQNFLLLRSGDRAMNVTGWFFTWIDGWTAPYEVMILAGMVAGFLSWTLRASR